MNRIKLLKVQYLPIKLQPGLLYVSEEFAVAGHLCPCGCGNKIITPLGPTEWSFRETAGKPTLRPSMGNWELPCRSHYFITKGMIEWATEWSEKQIQAGRLAEEKKKRKYYSQLKRNHKRKFSLSHFFRWLFND